MIGQDKRISVSVNCVLSSLAWCATVGLIITGAVTEVLVLHVAGLATSALAATLSMRGYCRQLGNHMQSAFEMGRDVGRSEVTQMRR